MATLTENEQATRDRAKADADRARAAAKEGQADAKERRAAADQAIKDSTGGSPDFLAAYSHARDADEKLDMLAFALNEVVSGAVAKKVLSRHFQKIGVAPPT